MEEKNKFMLKAIELSIKSAETIGGPFGCVIAKDNKIISEVSNKVTSTNDPTAHGEIVAIREACLKLNTFNLSGCELYSTCDHAQCVYLQFIGLTLIEFFMPIQEMMLKI